jgi:ABC-2 type transport system ATP-binding protein
MTQAMDTPMIESNSLSKLFGDFAAVDEASFSVQRGSIHGFIGPNGAGKSTTMKMLVGTLQISSGSAEVGGHPAGSIEARALIGFAPEATGTYDDMNAFEFLVYMAQICGVSGKEAARSAHELMGVLRLDGLERRSPRTFSAGQRQRLAIAQALIHKPDLLILDEPTANMDPSGRITIQDLLNEMVRERGVTVFLSSHVLPELEQVADSLTFINNGMIAASGPIAELRTRFSGQHFAVMSDDNETLLTGLKESAAISDAWIDADGYVNLLAVEQSGLRDEVNRVAAECGATVEQFSERRASLQDIYRELVGTEE